MSPETARLGELSEIIHQRSRLTIVAALYELDSTDFPQLRRVTQLTEGNLSRHLQTLEEAGIVAVEKRFVGRRPKTSLVLTKEGVRAFEQELSILGGLISAIGTASEARSRARRKTTRSVHARPSTAGG